MANVMGNGRIVNKGLIRVCRYMGQNCVREQCLEGDGYSPSFVKLSSNATDL